MGYLIRVGRNHARFVQVTEAELAEARNNPHPCVLINPDLSTIMVDGLMQPPHHWKIEGGKLTLKTPGEILRTEQDHRDHGVDLTMPAYLRPWYKPRRQTAVDFLALGIACSLVAGAIECLW